MFKTIALIIEYNNCTCPSPLVGSELFARGVNLNWPIREQSGTCSSRFQTAVGVENGSRLFVLPYVRILFKFSTTKNGLVITLEILYDGEFIWLYGNMIFMVIHCSPLWRESILWSWFAEKNCENGANWPAFHFVLRRGTTPMGKSPKTASNRPQTTHKTPWGRLFLF